MGKKREIPTGTKFGKLTIVKEVEPYFNSSGQSYRKFECLCDCGEVKNILLQHLVCGRSTSCRCGQLESATKHGYRNHTLYSIYEMMLNRCYNKNNKDYHNYGGRGISVCDEWRNSIEQFISDMGQRPSKKHSVDRINNNGNYSPSNCKWSTPKEQANNRRKRNINKGTDCCD